MKILVCVSKTPETTAKISFTNNNTTFNTAGIKYIMNPYDEWYALVRGIELKKQFPGSEVTLIHVGKNSSTASAILKKGVALGADKVHLIDREAKSSYITAVQIAKWAKDKNFDLILLGKESIDYSSGEVGGMIAELLKLPFIAFATDLQMEGTVATVTREIEGGKEVVMVKTPFVISASKGMAEQRIPNMRGIMKSKRTKIQVVNESELVNLKDPVLVKEYALPAGKTACKYIDPIDMEELVRLLHEEAKVI